MKTKNESELEAIFRNETRKMPGWKAPSRLSERVMAAIAKKAQLPWWKQSFWAWPLYVQITAFTMLSIISSFIMYLGWIAPGTLFNTPVWNNMVQLIDRFTVLWSSFLIVINALNSTLKTSLQSWLIIAFLISFFMCLFCLGAGSLVAHMAWKRSR